MPWLGYFIKLNLADVFVFHDAVEYSKRSLTRRCYLAHQSKKDCSVYLTVPLQKHSDYSSIVDLKLRHEDTAWIDKSMAQITQSYRKSPHFEENMPCISQLIQAFSDFETFSDYSIHCTSYLMNYLGIQAEVYRSSELALTGKKLALNIALIKQLEGTDYLSGMGARKYQSVEEFDKHQLKLHYLDSFNFIKEQAEAHHLQNPSYSIIDQLFHAGKDSIIEILQTSQQLLKV